MSQSLAQRLQQSVRTLELIEKVVKGPASGPESEVILAPGVKVRSLARRVSEMTFGLENAADAEFALLAPQDGASYALRGLSFMGPLSAQIVGPNIRVAIDLSAYATDADIDALADQIAALSLSTSTALDGFAADKASVAYVDAGLAAKLDTGSPLDALVDGGGFVRMTDGERAKLAALAVNYKGAYASLAALQVAVPAAAAGDWAILTHGAGVPSTFAAWDSDDAPAAWIDTGANAPTTIDWAQVTNKPATFPPTGHAHAFADLPGASQAEAEGGIAADKVLSPLRASQRDLARGAGLRNIAGRNGGLEIWTRGASVAVAASATAYTADGWYLSAGANQACTVSQVAGLASGSISAAQVARNNAQTGTGTLRFAFPLDSDELARLRGRPAALVFTAKAGANWSPAGGALTYAVYCGTGAVAKRGGTAYAGETAPITGTVDLAAGGAAQAVASAVSAAIGANVTCAEVQFSWSPTGAAGAADWVQIDDVHLEAMPPGIAVATPTFERTDLSLDLLRCRRFVSPWRVDWSGVAADAGYAYSAGFAFPVNMRATPSVVVTSQTNSARYPSGNGSVLNVNVNGITYVYSAASVGGNEAWTAQGLVTAEI